MKPRVGIIGTSGSLMTEGWSAAFAAAGGGEIVGNASLGSSHAVMLPYRLPLLEAAGMDVLIVDLCVNEQRALNRNLHDVARTAELFHWLRGWCAERGVLPVVLVLPHLTEAGTRASAVRDHWAGLCRAAGLPFLDGYRLIRHACLYAHQAPRHFMADQNHLSVRGARLVGEILAQTLGRFLQLAQIGTESAPAHDFRHHGLKGPMTRKTQLVTERLHRLDATSSLRVETGPGDLVGLVLNMGASTGALLIAGAESRVKRLDSPHARPEAGLLLVCWSLLDPVADDAGRFLLSVQPPALLAGQEENDHARPDHPPDAADPQVELAGLILRGPVREQRLVTSEGAEPDLLSLLD